MTERYEKLKEVLPEMLEIIEPLVDDLKPIVLEALLKAYLEESSIRSDTGRESEKEETELPPIKDKEWSGIAKIDTEGKFHLIIRNPKGTSNRDAIKRIIYITVRAFEELMDGAKAPRKVVNEALDKWRLYDGNAQAYIAGDKGLTRDGNQSHDGTLSLDEISHQEADGFIKDVLDEDVPKWTKTTGKPRPKKKGSKDKGKNN